MKLSPFFAGAVALAIAVPALATPRANAAFADLDFTKPADVATFNARLDEAAKKACIGAAQMQIDEHDRFVRCDKLAKRAGIAQLPEERRVAFLAAQAPQQLAGR